MLHEAEFKLSPGERALMLYRPPGTSEQSDYRWRREYGGLKAP